MRVDGPDELDAELLHDVAVVGVTAGASAPDDLVRSVIERLDPVDGIEPVYVTDEDEYFPPPRELRELIPALDLPPRAAPRRQPGVGRRSSPVRSPRIAGSTRPTCSAGLST